MNGGSTKKYGLQCESTQPGVLSSFFGTRPVVEWKTYTFVSHTEKKNDTATCSLCTLCFDYDCCVCVSSHEELEIRYTSFPPAALYPKFNMKSTYWGDRPPFSTIHTAVFLVGYDCDRKLAWTILKPWTMMIFCPFMGKRWQVPDFLGGGPAGCEGRKSSPSSRARYSEPGWKTKEWPHLDKSPPRNYLCLYCQSGPDISV